MAASTGEKQLTHDQFEAMVETWASRLRLNHWQIALDWDVVLDPNDAWAEVKPSKHFDDATIRLASNCATWTQDFANRTIVHELLHLHFRDLEQAMESLADHMAPATFDIWKDRAVHENEGMIDRMAALLVDLGGYA